MSTSSARGFLDAVQFVFRRCVGKLMRGSPPEPCEAVQELLKSLGIDPPQFLEIHETFYALRELEVEEIVTSATEVDVETITGLISERRKWVSTPLRHILTMGGCEDHVSWDKFLWILLRFCSLSRVELAQALFLVISKEVESLNRHYLTSQELQDFYWLYRECPIKAFSTKGIDFEKLPLTRYYVSDFAELLQRFTTLLNPMIHLQQSLQAHLPSSNFWDERDPSIAFCRKITAEFFSMDQVRVYLRGDPPFRETCDMIGPEALGAKAVNQDQWYLRTSGARMGLGLRQVSVWGELAPPEVLQGEDSQGAGEPAKGAPKTDAQPAVASQAAPGVPPGAPMLALEAPPVPGHPVQAAHKDAGRHVAWGPGTKGGAGPAPAAMDPSALSIYAATLNEANSGPADVLPPTWMRGAVIAPAPQVREPEPPLRRNRAGRTGFSSTGFTTGSADGGHRRLSFSNTLQSASP